jgi:hypothetical protein
LNDPDLRLNVLARICVVMSRRSDKARRSFIETRTTSAAAYSHKNQRNGPSSGRVKFSASRTINHHSAFTTGPIPSEA